MDVAPDELFLFYFRHVYLRLREKLSPLAAKSQVAFMDLYELRSSTVFVCVCVGSEGVLAL